jgi:flagellin FlaB
MFENIERDEERGQVGIGTLIVFIALVLVAAIAAGVLINTAGFLQSQAESTGEESTQQVSNNINVVSKVGTTVDDTASPAEVTEARLTLSLAPGADPINLDDTRFQYVNDSANSVTGDATPGTDGENVDLPSDTVLESGERVDVHIDLDAFSGALHEDTEATLIITTPSGAQREVVLRAPDTITNSDPVRL